jgi:hypothetical protein
MAVAALTSPRLVPGRTYTWDELGHMFSFKPRYLSVGGGMLPRPALNALLLVTWPGGARSFNYDDIGVKATSFTPAVERAAIKNLRARTAI